MLGHERAEGRIGSRGSEDFGSRRVSRDKAGDTDQEEQRWNLCQDEFRETKQVNRMERGRGRIRIKGTFERRSGRIGSKRAEEEFVSRGLLRDKAGELDREGQRRTLDQEEV